MSIIKLENNTEINTETNEIYIVRVFDTEGTINFPMGSVTPAVYKYGEREFETYHFVPNRLLPPDALDTLVKGANDSLLVQLMERKMNEMRVEFQALHDEYHRLTRITTS